VDQRHASKNTRTHARTTTHTHTHTRTHTHQCQSCGPMACHHKHTHARTHNHSHTHAHTHTLPPVSKPWTNGMPPDLFMNWGWAFQAPAWKRCEFEHVLLTKVWQCYSPRYGSATHKVWQCYSPRYGSATHQGMAVLRVTGSHC